MHQFTQLRLFCSRFDRPDLRYEPGFHKYSSIEALQKYAGRQIEDSEVFYYGDMGHGSLRIQSWDNFTGTEQHMDTLLK
jgi:hypothetical protein